VRVPVVAAGGVEDGRGFRGRALAPAASAVLLGNASSLDRRAEPAASTGRRVAHQARDRFHGDSPRAFSGRAARGIRENGSRGDVRRAGWLLSPVKKTRSRARSRAAPPRRGDAGFALALRPVRGRAALARGARYDELVGQGSDARPRRKSFFLERL